MKLLHPVGDRHQPGFSKEEKEEARNAIYANIIESIVALLEAMTGMYNFSNWFNLKHFLTFAKSDYILDILVCISRESWEKFTCEFDFTPYNLRETRILWITIFLIFRNLDWKTCQYQCDFTWNCWKYMNWAKTWIHNIELNYDFDILTWKLL